jgi:hypothetical protein
MNNNVPLTQQEDNVISGMHTISLGESQHNAVIDEDKEYSLLDTGEQVITLKTGANTSAGVYDRSGKLIRTLWSGKWMEAGTHEVTWEGKDDAGNKVAIDGHTIKVLSSNVSYEWEGAAIGNTGKPITGSNKLHSNSPARDVCFIGDEVYWALGYHEKWPAQWVTSLMHPENGKTWFEPLQQTNQSTVLVATDGALVYWAGHDTYSQPTVSFIWAMIAATKQRAIFANGVPAAMAWGSTYQSTISYKSEPNSYITGLAVQRAGKYLFVSRKAQNELQVIHKTTGALVQTIPVTSVGLLAIDRGDKLWVAQGDSTIKQYSVNSNGTITPTGKKINLNGIIGGMDVSPDNRTIAVCDMDNQIVKGFNTVTGVLLWTLGSKGGYLMDATVTNTKFFWKDAKGIQYSFIKYTPNGGFYLGDPINMRYLQFDSSRNYVRTISWINTFYKAGIDPNNTARLFCVFLEFKIDHTKPLQQCWILKKNWGATFSNLYDKSKISNIVTFPNKRTYGLLRGSSIIAPGKENSYYVVELVEGGTMRITTTEITPLSSFLQKDGSLIKATISGGTTRVVKYQLSGFNNNNPLWNTTGTVLAISSLPNFRFNSLGITENKIIGFDISARNIYDNSDYHLLAFPIGGNTPMWKTSRGTSRDYLGPYPEGGWFDNGNGVNLGLNGGGGFMQCMNNHIIWNYHGEFWKQSHTNRYNHYDASTGLLIGSFGTITPDNVTNEESAYGEDGNALTGGFVFANDNYYLYHNGEIYGLHRWKLHGMNTIAIQTLPVANPNEVTRLEGNDLLVGLIRYTSLQDGVAGWHRSPTTDYQYPNNEFFKAVVGYASYDPFEPPDLTVQFHKSSGSAYVTRDLGDNAGAVNWELSGAIMFGKANVNTSSGKAGCYLEVLDSTGKVICRLYRTRSGSLRNVLIGNDKIISSDNGDRKLTLSNYYYQPFSIRASNSQITFQYGSFEAQTTAVLVDNNAIWNDPSALRFYCFTNSAADNLLRSISLNPLRFRVDKAYSSIV